MVKYWPKRYYRKNYYKANKRQFNYIASHYLKYKIKNQYQVNFDTNGLTGDVSLTFQTILDSGTNDFTLLSKHFLQYKVTGIAITVIPNQNTDQYGQFTFQGVSAAMSILNINEDNTWAGVSKSPNAVLLGNEKITKYYKLNTGWFATNNQAAPSMKICTSSRGIPLAGQMTWNFIVTMYVCFKNVA